MTSTFDPSALPTKRVGAGVLLRNPEGHVLLVEPTYKDGWEIPGGLVEAGESPREAAQREVLEELGVELDLGELLVIHYAVGMRTPGDGVMFVFDAGTTSLACTDFALPVDELRSARFVPPSELSGHLHAGLVRRMTAAIAAADAGRIAYLER